MLCYLLTLNLYQTCLLTSTIIEDGVSNEKIKILSKSFRSFTFYTKITSYTFIISIHFFLTNFSFSLTFGFHRLARGEDVQTIFDIVKAAYRVELGDSGVAFKNADRYTSIQSVIEDLSSIWVLRDGGEIVGCIKGVITYNTKMVEIGPVAVKPDMQVNCIITLYFA